MGYNYSVKAGEYDDLNLHEDDLAGGYRTIGVLSDNDTHRERELIGDADYGKSGGFAPGEIWLLNYSLSASSRSFDDFIYWITGDSHSPDDDEYFYQNAGRLSSTYDDGELGGSILVTWDMVEDSFNEDIQFRMLANDDFGGNMFLSYQAVRVKRAGDPEGKPHDGTGSGGETF